jgi:respiratory burst oxidase
MAACERRREQAQLNRSRAGARRALKGLRVEERFNDLAREGLVSCNDFGECNGTSSCCRYLVAIHIVIRTCKKVARS